jgi:hypothetical protein
MGSLGLVGLGCDRIPPLVLQVINRLRSDPDRAGADLLDNRVVILGCVDLCRGQCGGAFSSLLIVIVKGVEQTHTESIITVIVARDWQTGHRLTELFGRDGTRLPNGFLVPRLFLNWLRLNRRLGSSGYRLLHLREYGRGRRGQ